MNQRLKIIIVLSLVSWLFPAAGITQQAAENMIISKRFFSVEDGLASREVFCAIQDNDGFMWFGTRSGLNRYDGKNFKLFTKQRDGLAENKIIQLAKDNHNHLFIVYGNPGYARSAMRISVMDLTTYTLKSLKETFPNMPFDENYVYWVANAGDDLCFLVSNPFRYWRLTSAGFKLVCEMKAWDKPGSAENWLTAAGRHHTTTWPFCRFYKDCALLFITEDLPMYFCSPGTTKIFPGPPKGPLITPGKQFINGGDELPDKFNAMEHTQRRQAPVGSNGDSQIYLLAGDFSTVLVYRAADGLFLYDFTELKKLLDPEELKISSGYGLYSFFIDRQDNIWICMAGGLIKMKLQKNNFAHYFTKQQLRDSSDNQVRGIYDDAAGNVYASVWNRFCLNSGSGSRFLKIGLNNVMYGICRCMNKIYLGEANLYELEPGALKRLTNVNLREIWVIDSLAPNKLILGCTDSILTFDLATNEFETIKHSGVVACAPFA
jgi:hypothetical protein